MLQGITGIGVFLAHPGEHLDHRLTTQHVVAGDDLVGHTEQAEHPRAVLACAAVEHRRVGGQLGQHLQGPAHGAGAFEQHRQIAGGDEFRVVPSGQLLVTGHCAGHGQVVVAHIAGCLETPSL